MVINIDKKRSWLSMGSGTGVSKCASALVLIKDRFCGSLVDSDTDFPFVYNPVIVHIYFKLLSP